MVKGIMAEQIPAVEGIMPAKRVVTAEEGLEQVVRVHRVEGEVSDPGLPVTNF